MNHKTERGLDPNEFRDCRSSCRLQKQLFKGNEDNDSGDGKQTQESGGQAAVLLIQFP
jgi:hypothetical protein